MPSNDQPVEFVFQYAAPGGQLASAATDSRFHAVADAAPIGIFEAGTDGQSRYTNPAWHKITQLSERAAKGSGWQKMLHPDDAELVVANWQAALERPHAYSQRFRIVVSGNERWVDACVAPTRLGGVVSGFVGTLVDVTSVVTAETSLSEARDRALAGSRLKSEFIANISHEIRTPLNGVLGLTQILADTVLDPKQQSYVDTIRRAGGDLLQLLNDVLDLSKVEAGAMHAESVNFDAGALIRDTAALFEPSATCRGLVLDVMISPHLVPVAAGDPTRLRQVISNLISNAIKFTDHGGVTVVAEQTADGREGVIVRIAVTDTGIGIPADDHDAIFEPFAQADSSTTRRFGGSGLGLSISKRIIEMMGGELAVRSLPGRGSTFTISVPLRTVESAGLETAHPIAPATSPPLRILVVEDNAVNQLVMQTILGKLGHTVDVAENGAVAVTLGREQSYDCILMDCQMPVMDGYAATAAIRALPGDAASTPIVALTASAMAADQQRCIDSGMDAYLTKPINQADLTATIARVTAPRIRG